jgi:hypothetical protein
MNFQVNRNGTRLLLILVGVFVLGIVVWMVSGLSNDPPTNFDKSTARSASGFGGLNSSVKSDDSSKMARHPTTQAQSIMIVPATKSLAWMESMAELLQQAPRADNTSTRSFAVYMPAALCSSLSTALIVGHSSFEADIPARPVPPNKNGLERIASRCSEYKGLGVDKLRSPVLAELKAKNAPLAAFFAASNGPPELARIQLERVLADHDATALQPLAMVWPMENADRLASTLPDQLKPFAQGIATAAFDIALCREGAYCGADSIARDMICAKFAECDATDVEGAYRRLHVNAGISFAETSKIADEVRNAIQRRDAAALWPDTVKLQGARK